MDDISTILSSGAGVALIAVTWFYIVWQWLTSNNFFF
jgi:hypothetical protein